MVRDMVSKCLKIVKGSLTSTNSTHDTEVGLVRMKKFNRPQVILESKGEAKSPFCGTELANQSHVPIQKKVLQL